MPSRDDLSNVNLPTNAFSLEEELRLAPGKKLEQYTLLERLGAGGMGEVYKALHMTMQRVVAIKIMAPHLVFDERAKKRFLREAQSAGRLDHPNIVRAFDARADGPHCFLVMEYVEGWDAAALLQTCGVPPIAVACELIRQAAVGLHHAYEMGIVHRDIKPGNILVAPRRVAGLETPLPGLRADEPHPRAPSAWPTEMAVKILDLGLARLADPTDGEAPPVRAATPLTREGFVVGTPEFMSPEQASNSKQIDIRSDIYSLGCTLYCLLTGRPPFTGNSLLEVMVQHMQTAPESVERHRPDVPAPVASVLGRMLAKKVDQRFATPAEVAEALRPYALPGADSETVPRAPSGAVVLGTGGSTEVVPSASSAAVTRPVGPRPIAAGPSPGQLKMRGALGCVALGLLFLCSLVLGIYWMRDRDDFDGPHTVAALDSGTSDAGFVPTPAGKHTPTWGELKEAQSVGRLDVSITEVTRGMFRRFVNDTGYKTSAEVGDGADLIDKDNKRQRTPGVTWMNQGDDAAPVVCVTWDDAIEYCNWASIQDRKKPCYSKNELLGGSVNVYCDFTFNGYRLPTEVEWEYLAAGGKPLPVPQNELLEMAWIGEPKVFGPQQERKRKGANGYGLHNVWGNAWEWCWDARDEGSSERVIRGGGWSDPAVRFTAGPVRERRDRSYRANDLGFRIVRTLPPQDRRKFGGGRSLARPHQVGPAGRARTAADRQRRYGESQCPHRTHRRCRTTSPASRPRRRRGLPFPSPTRR